MRPYMNVLINDVESKGLLDSGASVNCLGNGCIELADRLCWNILDYKSLIIKTADGKSQQIKGMVKTKITCQNDTKNLTLYLVPFLSQSLY